MQQSQETHKFISHLCPSCIQFPQLAAINVINSLEIFSERVHVFISKTIYEMQSSLPTAGSILAHFNKQVTMPKSLPREEGGQANFTW